MRLFNVPSLKLCLAAMGIAVFLLTMMSACTSGGTPADKNKSPSTTVSQTTGSDPGTNPSSDQTQATEPADDVDAGVDFNPTTAGKSNGLITTATRQATKGKTGRDTEQSAATTTDGTAPTTTRATQQETRPTTATTSPGKYEDNDQWSPWF